MLKKTKIICTQGPATEKPGVIEALIENGMNCARFNFSHGDHAEHLSRINMVREAAKKAGKVVSLILDTKGPEMRLGEFRDGKVMLEKGNKFTLTYSDEPGDETHVSVNHKGLYSEVQPGDTLLLSDGLVALKVDAIHGKDIETTIQNSGQMSTKKRVAAPGISLGLPPISEQDEKDIIFGCEQGMDFVAASFIQRPEDVLAIRKLIEEHDGHLEIIPKIENLAGVKNFDKILEVSDGIMVARGDLGVEVPAEDVPLIQKEIIKKCNEAGKPVIVATQMLESMTDNPRPTRAEVSDGGGCHHEPHRPAHGGIPELQEPVHGARAGASEIPHPRRRPRHGADGLRAGCHRHHHADEIGIHHGSGLQVPPEGGDYRLYLQ